MTISIIAGILVLAIGLILMEIFFVPGVGIPGIIGAVLLFVGVVMAYQIDDTTGHITITLTALASTGLGFLAFNSKTWERVAQKDEITSKVIHNLNQLKVGDQGKALSRLNPMGNIFVNETIIEATSRGDYIDEGTQIEVIKIEGNRVVVKPA